MGGYRWYDLSAPVTGQDLFATAQDEERVSVWSLGRRQKLSDLTTVFQFGGKRLALIPGAEPILVAGTYYAGGVCAYDANTGLQTWQRRDLKQVQTLQWVPSGLHPGLVGVGFDSRPFRLLDAATGADMAELRAVRALYASPYGEIGLQVTARDIRLCSLVDWSVRWKQSLYSRTVLHAACGPEGVAISEMGGSLRGFDLEGRPAWEWAPEPGAHCLKVSWCEPIQGWAAVAWSYKQGGPKLLILLRDGAAHTAEIGPAVDAEFFAGGTRLITTQGQVLAVPTLASVWRFDDEAG